MERYNKLKSSRPPCPLTPLPSYSDTTYPLSQSFNDLLHLWSKPPILPEPVISKPPILPKPVIDTISKPLTKITDSKKNKIQIIPKKIESDDIDDVNFSKRLSKLFPEINQVTKEKVDDEKSELDIENVFNKLKKFCPKLAMKNPFEFEFFTGGENKKFDDTMRSYGLVISTTIIMVQAN